MNQKFFIIVVIGFSAVALSLVGCGPKDIDPQTKVDAPGYYNGPMNTHGTAGKSNKGSKDQGPATAGAATG